MEYLEPQGSVKIGLLVRLQLWLLVAGAALALWVGVPFSWLGTAGYGAFSWGALGAMASYGLAAWLTRLRLPVGRSLRRIVTMLRPLLAGITWPQLVLVSVLAGFGEEVVFRVLLQGWLADWLSPAWGIAIASAVFALLHAMSPLYFFVTLVFGLWLGVAYWGTGSVMLVVTWHALYDLVAIAVITRRPQWLGVEGNR